MGRETIKQKIAKMEQKIEELTKQRDTLQQLVYALEQEKRDLQDSKDTDFSESSIYQDMQRKMDMQEQKIKNLKSENERLKEKSEALIKMLEHQTEIPNAKERIKELENENGRLKEKVRLLEEQSQKVEEHNARHAGRKPDNPEIKAKRQQFAALLAEHRPMREIMQIMNISKSTYYNYYRHISEQNINFLDSTDN